MRGGLLKGLCSLKGVVGLWKNHKSAGCEGIGRVCIKGVADMTVQPRDWSEPRTCPGACPHGDQFQIVLRNQLQCYRLPPKQLILKSIVIFAATMIFSIAIRSSPPGRSLTTHRAIPVCVIPTMPPYNPVRTFPKLLRRRRRPGQE